MREMPIVGERVDCVERLRGRRRGELHQLRRAIEAQERVGQIVSPSRHARGQRVGLQLPLR